MKISASVRRNSSALRVVSPRVNNYREIIRDDVGEILIPDSQGDFLRLIDLCWLMAMGKSIADACLEMNVHPLHFMVYKTRHAEIDDVVRAAIEIAGEEDIERATNLMENLSSSNLEVSREKARFFIWRGKQRYYRLYGEKKSNIDISIGKTENYNKFELSSTIRQLEHSSTDIELDKSEYTCDD